MNKITNDASLIRYYFRRNDLICDRGYCKFYYIKQTGKFVLYVIWLKIMRFWKTLFLMFYSVFDIKQNVLNYRVFTNDSLKVYGSHLFSF